MHPFNLVLPAELLGALKLGESWCSNNSFVFKIYMEYEGLLSSNNIILIGQTLRRKA